MIAAFYNKHQNKILILSPLLLAFGFVALSSVSALITIHNTPIPTNFEEVTTQVENYVLYEMNPESNEKKWILKGESASSNPEDTKAIIKKVTIEAFKNNQLEFIMTSDDAEADEKTKEIYLKNNVIVKDPKGDFSLRSGGLKFSDDLDLMVDTGWNLKTNEGYQISGNRGIINKSLTSIVSTGNASVRKDKLNLSADKIIFRDNEPIIATGTANLVLDANKSLKADKIKFELNGNVNAQGNVGVKTDKISCFAQSLKIIPNANNSPSKAILRGSPYALHDGKKIAADVITYDFNLNTVSAEGNVHTKFIR